MQFSLSFHRYSSKTQGICEVAGVTFNIYRSSDNALVKSIDAPGTNSLYLTASSIPFVTGEKYYVQSVSRSVFCGEQSYPYSSTKATSVGWTSSNGASQSPGPISSPPSPNPSSSSPPSPAPTQCVSVLGFTYCQIPAAGLAPGNYYFLFADGGLNFYLSPFSNGLGWKWNAFQGFLLRTQKTKG